MLLKLGAGSWELSLSSERVVVVKNTRGVASCGVRKSGLWASGFVFLLIVLAAVVICLCRV